MWSSESDELLWVDIEGRRIRRYRPADGHQQDLLAPGRPGAVVPRRAGGYMVALEAGFAVLDDNNSFQIVADTGIPTSTMRMNDGKCDSAGRFWAGTMSTDGQRGLASLFRLDPDFTLTEVVNGVSISNGLGWSPDDTVMYYVDSPTGTVDAFDFDVAEGVPSARRTLVTIDVAVGEPDGLSVDTAGFLWVAIWGGSAVHRYAPDGSLDRVVQLPASHITSCCFGGPRLDELYITSAKDELSPEQLEREPLAGAVFRCDVGITGMPTKPFG
jgi:sugar lactone lactonase YvrE